MANMQAISFTPAADLAKSKRLKNMVELNIISQEKYEHFTSSGALPCCSSLHCPFLMYETASPEFSAVAQSTTDYGNFIWDTVSLGIMCQALKDALRLNDYGHPKWRTMPQDLQDYLQSGNAMWLQVNMHSSLARGGEALPTNPNGYSIKSSRVW